MTNGATERICCKATYAVNATGKAVQQTLRCASDSYRVEVSSNIISKAPSLSGSGLRRLAVCREVFLAALAVRGSVANVAGAGFKARLDLRTQGEGSQSR